MDRIGAMTVFVAVVERGGFASASRALGVSPSAVTRIVAGPLIVASSRLVAPDTLSA